VADVAVHPYAGLVALGTGQRHFPLPGANYDEEEEEEEDEGDREERRLLTEEAGASRLVLYRVPKRAVGAAGAGGVGGAADVAEAVGMDVTDTGGEGSAAAE
jgi:hypothetical protein